MIQIVYYETPLLFEYHKETEGENIISNRNRSNDPTVGSFESMRGTLCGMIQIVYYEAPLLFEYTKEKEEGNIISSRNRSNDPTVGSFESMRSTLCGMIQIVYYEAPLLFEYNKEKGRENIVYLRCDRRKYRNKQVQQEKVSNTREWFEQSYGGLFESARRRNT